MDFQTRGQSIFPMGFVLCQTQFLSSFHLPSFSMKSRINSGKLVKMKLFSSPLPPQQPSTLTPQPHTLTKEKEKKNWRKERKKRKIGKVWNINVWNRALLLCPFCFFYFQGICEKSLILPLVTVQYFQMIS